MTFSLTLEQSWRGRWCCRATHNDVTAVRFDEDPVEAVRAALNVHGLPNQPEETHA